jgi:CelD/BcsL family acetyltransferase involved in cellulose biosynthesis
MDIELVTEVDRLQDHVAGWDALAQCTSQARGGGGIVAAWAAHMLPPDTELRVWVATEGTEVVGVLPFVAEAMPRGRFRLLPPTTDLMIGSVPMAHPDCAQQVADAVADDFVAHAEPVNMATIYWLPQGSPWSSALGRRLVEPDWVEAERTRYDSHYTSVPSGMDPWMAARDKVFRQGVGRRARRAEEEGFRLVTTEDPVEIMERLPRLQSFYVRSQEARGGQGYRFDEDMIRTIETAQALSPAGRFALTVLENDDVVIGASLVLRAGTNMSCWLVGYDPEWSRFGPGVAALLESIAAGSRAGCDAADLGLGDHHYLRDFKDACAPLESVTWCRPRLARLLQLGSPGVPGAGGETNPVPTG